MAQLLAKKAKMCQVDVIKMTARNSMKYWCKCYYKPHSKQLEKRWLHLPSETVDFTCVFAL